MPVHTRCETEVIHDRHAYRFPSQQDEGRTGRRDGVRGWFYIPLLEYERQLVRLSSKSPTRRLRHETEFACSTCLHESRDLIAVGRLLLSSAVMAEELRDLGILFLRLRHGCAG